MTAPGSEWRAHAPYWLMLAGAIVLHVAFGPPARLAEIRDLLPDVSLTLPIGGAFLALWLGYGGVARRPSPLPARLETFYGATLVVVFQLMPVALSIDLLDYIRRGRILAVYGANPHLVTAATYPQDAFYAPVGWTFLPTPYGPAFTLLSAGLTWLAGDGKLANVFAFKLLMTVAHVANAVIIRRISGSARAAALYLCNPFVLLEVVANGHNDVLPATAALASLAYTQRAAPVAAASLLALAAWIKAPFALLFPLWLRYAAGGGAPADMVRRMALPLLAAAAVTLLLWLPFFEGLSVFHIYRLHAGMLTKWSLPALVDATLSIAGVGQARLLATVVCAALAAAVLAPAVLRARDFDGYLRAVVVLLLVVPLLAMGWLLPWYFVWPLCFLPLLPGRNWLAANLALTAGGLLQYIQQTYLAFDSSYLENVVLGVTSIAPVFIVLAVAWMRETRHRRHAA